MSPSGPVYIVYSRGPSIEPWGTPPANGRLVDCSLSMDKNCFLSARYNVNHWQAAPHICRTLCIAICRGKSQVLFATLSSLKECLNNFINIIINYFKIISYFKVNVTKIHPLNLVMQRTVYIFIPSGCPWSWKDKGWRHWWGSRVCWHLWLCCWSFQDDWWKGSTIRT